MVIMVAAVTTTRSHHLVMAYACKGINGRVGSSYNELIIKGQNNYLGSPWQLHRRPRLSFLAMYRYVEAQDDVPKSPKDRQR